MEQVPALDNTYIALVRSPLTFLILSVRHLQVRCPLRRCHHCRSVGPIPDLTSSLLTGPFSYRLYGGTAKAPHDLLPLTPRSYSVVCPGLLLFPELQRE